MQDIVKEMLDHQIIQAVLIKKPDFKAYFKDLGQPDIYKMPMMVYGDKKLEFTREYVKHVLQIQKIAQQEVERGDFVRDKLYPLSKAVLADFDGYDIYYEIGGITVESFIDDCHIWAEEEYDKMVNFKGGKE